MYNYSSQKKSKNNINHDLKSPSKVNSALHNAMSNKTSIFGKSLWQKLSNKLVIREAADAVCGVVAAL